MVSIHPASGPDPASFGFSSFALRSTSAAACPEAGVDAGDDEPAERDVRDKMGKAEGRLHGPPEAARAVPLHGLTP
jgi:hypothetical protein